MKFMYDVSKYKAVIFDLDDTLITETDYLFAAYRQMGFPQLIDLYKKYGRKNLFQRVDGNIEEMLEILRTVRVRLKVNPLLKPVLELDKLFFILTDGNSKQQMNKISQTDISLQKCAVIFSKKPDSSARMILDYPLRACDVVYFGNSELDEQTAKIAGIDFIRI